jgi:hypothetical protein
MRLERHERGIHVIEKPAGSGSAVAGVHKRFCGTTGTVARRARQFTIKMAK